MSVFSRGWGQDLLKQLSPLWKEASLCDTTMYEYSDPLIVIFTICTINFGHCVFVILPCSNCEFCSVLSATIHQSGCFCLVGCFRECSEKNVIQAHSVLLAAASPKLYSYFRAGDGGNFTVVTPDVPVSVWRNILSFIYEGT